MNFIRSFSGIALIGIFFSGCALNLSAPEKTHYRFVLEKPKVTPHHRRQSRFGVNTITSSGFIDSRRIVFSKRNGQVGYYQLSSWTETPAREFGDALLLALEESGMFQSVTRSTSGAIADYQLNGELLDCSHNLKTEEHNIELSLRVEILEMSSRNIIASRVFSIKTPVGADQVSAVVHGFSLASSQLLQEVVNWIDEAVPE